MLRNSKTAKESAHESPLKDMFEEVLEALAGEAKGITASGTNSEEGIALAIDILALAGDVPDDGVVDVGQVATPEEQARDTDGKIKQFLEYADRFCRQFVKLIPEPETHTLFAEQLKNTPFNDLHGEPGTNYVLVVYDSKLAGESSSSPHLRPPPFQQARFRKLLHGIFGLRNDFEEVPVGDCFLFLDGPRPSLETVVACSC